LVNDFEPNGKLMKNAFENSFDASTALKASIWAQLTTSNAKVSKRLGKDFNAFWQGDI
jgi:hypothetical protein